MKGYISVLLDSVGNKYLGVKIPIHDISIFLKEKIEKVQNIINKE